MATSKAATSSNDILQLGGQDTILTEKVYENFGDDKEKQVNAFIHLDIFTGSFFTLIALSIICVTYLFKQSTEYISWIFGLILIVITPISWIQNFIYASNSPYKMYVFGCLFCGIILNFAAILMVIIYTTILNKRIQDFKNNAVLAPGQKVTNLRINTNIIDNYNKIKIMFTTNLFLCIAIILNFFVYEQEKKGSTTKEKNSPYTKMPEHISWWHNILPRIICFFDNKIVNWIDIIPMPGFLKMFFLFCGGFLFFFFSFFVKLITTWKDPNIEDPYVQNLISEFGYGLKGIYPASNFDIVNFPDILVETAGPVNFAALASFFITVVLFIIFEFLKNLLIKPLITNFSGTGIDKFLSDKFHYKYTPHSGMLGIIINALDKIKYLFFFFIVFLPIYFITLGGKNNKSSSNIDSQNTILFILCFLLALLGIPFILMVLEIFSRILNFSIFNDIYSFIYNTCATNICKIRSIITITFLLISLFGISIGLFMYGGSLDGKNTGHWLSEKGNNKYIKLIVVLIMSLMVGWFCALHLKFNMFYFLYDCVMKPSRAVLFTFAPLAVVGLAITQVIIADLTAKEVGPPIRTDG